MLPGIVQAESSASSCSCFGGALAGNPPDPCLQREVFTCRGAETRSGTGETCKGTKEKDARNGPLLQNGAVSPDSARHSLVPRGLGFSPEPGGARGTRGACAEARGRLTEPSPVRVGSWDVDSRPLGGPLGVLSAYLVPRQGC